MDSTEINELIALHCGRLEDERLLQKIRDAARAIADHATSGERMRCAALCRPAAPLTTSDPEWAMLEELSERIAAGT